MQLIIWAIILGFFLLLLIIYAISRHPSDGESDFDDIDDFESASDNQKPKIGAEVSKDFYDSIHEYCKRNSMTVSSLIRTSIKAYISSHSALTPDSTSVSKKTAVVQADGLWTCPWCGVLNAKYIGTCSCGGTKELAPKPASPKKNNKGKKGFWECPKCGVLNANYVGTCSCGNAKKQ